MRKRNTIRLNESQLHNMISESVKQVLKEAKMVPGTNYLGRPYGPKSFGQPHRVVDHNEKYFNMWGFFICCQRIYGASTAMWL